MKPKTFVTSALLSAGSVLLYQKKDDIISEFTETKQTLTGAQNNIQNIKENLAIIKNEQANLSKINRELSYKFKAFNNDLQAHLTEIQKTTNHYQKK